MAKTVVIESTHHFSSLLSSSSIVVADFYADWCGPCKQISPLYEQLSQQLSRPNKITFTKINIDIQKELAQSYGVTSIPTFMIFKNARSVQTIKGADPGKLSQAVKKLANEAEALGSGKDGGSGGFGEAGGSGSSVSWLGPLPKGYGDVTDQIDIKGLELLNYDKEFGDVRTLFDSSSPSKTSDKAKQKNWIESDTDEQLLLFIPFQSTLKVHSIYLTSHAPKLTEDDGDDDIPTRPRTIRLFTNQPHNLGFEEAEDLTPTQSLTLSASEWDNKTDTVRLDLRFVKFQNVSSLVLFVKEGERDGAERTRVDRLRIVGESGERREMGKLEKVGEGD